MIPDIPPVHFEGAHPFIVYKGPFMNYAVLCMHAHCYESHNEFAVGRKLMLVWSGHEALTRFYLFTTGSVIVCGLC